MKRKTKATPKPMPRMSVMPVINKMGIIDIVVGEPVTQAGRHHPVPMRRNVGRPPQLIDISKSQVVAVPAYSAPTPERTITLNQFRAQVMNKAGHDSSIVVPVLHADGSMTFMEIE